MWWSTFRAVAADRTVLHVGQCFPKATVARPNFAAEAEPYYRRWDAGNPRDTDPFFRHKRSQRDFIAPAGAFTAKRHKKISDSSMVSPNVSLKKVTF